MTVSCRRDVKCLNMCLDKGLGMRSVVVRMLLMGLCHLTGRLRWQPPEMRRTAPEDLLAPFRLSRLRKGEVGQLLGVTSDMPSTQGPTFVNFPPVPLFVR